MLQKILYFIKYNNATVVILAVILLLGGGALAAGPEGVGQKETRLENIDNSLLIAANLSNYNMDFKIEKVEEDENYYYATYSFLDLAVLDQAWQYQLNSKTQKISKKIKQDLGEYLAGFLAKHRQARVRQLKEEQRLAGLVGESKRLEVTEYSGLIGKTLNLAAKVFPGYEPVKKRELPAPNFDLEVNVQARQTDQSSGATDNLTQIYNDYIAEHPDLFTDSASSPQDTPVAEATSTAEVAAEPITEPASVDVIELPAEPAPETTAPAETAPGE
ncbi:MAG: hypothetical protein AUJ11_01580 [Parcubacteria group bacterium CG1_02_44_65]|nr:MAG: hypothetical protein AUJ11_01580 [Parcubacteria group bacterium CG1_02_44_65]